MTYENAVDAPTHKAAIIAERPKSMVIKLFKHFMTVKKTLLSDWIEQ